MKRHILLLPIFAIVSVLGWGTPNITKEYINFSPLRNLIQLPTNEVRNLFQDKEGYIWIATYNGLVRYDGYSTKVYHAEPNGSEKSIDGFINAIAEDYQCNLWIGTHNGLYKLNKKNDKIENISLPHPQVTNVETVTCTHKGSVWVGTNKGLFIKKESEANFTQYKFETNIDVKSILEDKRGQIWIGTWSQGLYRYDPTRNQLYTYQNVCPGNSAHIIFQDKNENIWIGTWRYGLLKMQNPYDMQHYGFVRYTHDENNPSSIADNIIYSITQDRNTGKLWIGSRSALSIMESENGTFTNYYPSDKSGHLPFNEVDALLSSADGLMWVGMLGGGIRVANTKTRKFSLNSLKSIRNIFPSASVRAICPIDQNWLWISIMGFGFVKYNMQSHEVIPYNQIPAFRSLPPVSTVNEIIRLREKGEYCFATWDDGLWIFNGEKVEEININSYPQLTDVCIYSVLEDKQKNIWLGTRSGIFLLTPQRKMYALNDLIENNAYIPPKESIFRLQEDKDGHIWAATPNSGIWKITPKNHKFVTKQYSINLGNAKAVGAMALYIDSENTIWAGTNGKGVNVYNPHKDRFQNALPNTMKKGEVVSCILEDNQKGLWITMTSEMIHIDKTKKGKNIQVFTTEDGLQDYIFNRNACAKGKDGKLYFGGVHGINSFFPEDINYDTVSYPVVLTDLKIFNTSISHMSDTEVQKIMDSTLEYTKHITLSYKQNNFSIGFSVLNYINPILNKYEYKLEGYDNQWISTEGYQPAAFYNNLPAGTYTFYVRGSNPNGLWSNNIRSVAITILPPPWLTWWAYCIYAILFALLVWYSYRIIRKRIHLQQMVELANIQRQKDEEINHSKLQFFTNITHELLTPLSIISASIDEIKIHFPETRNSLPEIEDNLLRLKRLIQQILEFRKVENGRQKLKVSYGNLTTFLQHSAQAFTPLVRKRSLHFAFQNMDTEYQGYFDHDKLDKIIYNLLSNAAKYTTENKTITIAQAYHSEQNLFQISISNPGEPIPENKLKHLFERFYEGEYRKFHTIGTGIGLSLTKDLTLLHHGQIKVESDKEKGNTFTVLIPINKDAYSKEEIDEENESHETIESNIPQETTEHSSANAIQTFPAHSPDKEKPSLLLVEDNEELRNVMQRILTDYFNLTEASCGETALIQLEDKDIDIIVSDVMMPGMDGFELCKKVKEKFETKHIPVILLTAKTSDIDRIEGYEAGADGYICKPLNIPVLLAKIDNLLKKSGSHNGNSRKQLVFEAKHVDYTSQDEEFLKKAVECVNAHLSDVDFDTVTFVKEMQMSRSTLNEKLKQLTDMTPLAFISSIRLQAAFRLLEEKKKIRVSELAYAVGFNDPKYFSQCFKKKFGFLPKEYTTNKENDNE